MSSGKKTKINLKALKFDFKQIGRHSQSLTTGLGARRIACIFFLFSNISMISQTNDYPHVTQQGRLAWAKLMSLLFY